MISQPEQSPKKPRRPFAPKSRRETVRDQFTFKDEHWPELKIIYDIGLDDALQPIELFLNSGKSGQHMELMLRDFAIVASLARQWGCPFEEMASKIGRNSAGKPTSPLGAVLDLIK